MILAKVRVTARDVDDDKVLKETTVYVAPADRRSVPPIQAIEIARRQNPELDSSAIRFATAVLASVKIPRKRRLNAVERVKLAAFLGDSVPTAHSGWLDETVHDLAAAEASRANNGGLESQLDYLCGQLGTEGLLRLLQGTLMDEEA
jgi:hypothetical protein